MTRQVPAVPAPAPAPFIVGVSRSGTTLLRLMLDSHPLLAIPPETFFVAYALRDFAAPRGSATPDRTLAERFVERVTGIFAWPDFGLDAARFRRAVLSLPRFTVAAGVRCFYELYAAGQGKPRWGDKTPIYVRHMREIAEHLPEARFIHLIRDGRAVAASLGRMRFYEPGMDMAALAERWSSDVILAREQGRNLLSYLELRYERLVAEPEATLRQLCAFIELPFDRRMLDYPHRAAVRLAEFRDWHRPDGSLRSTGDERRAIHARTLERPDPKLIDSWRHILRPAQVAEFERHAGELLEELGYTAAP